MTVVVDASVVIQWYLVEGYTSEAEKLLTAKYDLHAPDLLYSEFGNILWKKCRQNDLEVEEAKTALDLFERQQITIHSSREMVKMATLGALETGHAVYDWIYLALALSLKCKLVTADRRFFLRMRKTIFKRHMIWIENVPSLS